MSTEQRDESAERGQALDGRLAEAERLAGIGRLVSKVAHELSEPLDGVLRYVNLSMRLLAQGQTDKPLEYLQRCREALERMAHISGELLEFSRRSHTRADFVQVHDLIDEALRTMEMKLDRPAVQVTREYCSGLPEVRGGNLYQVFCNLIKNAFDAMGDGGELSISTDIDDSQVISVRFHDTGPGFDSALGEKLFEPFFTTKEGGKGTGLGLAICKDIVERCGGRISADNGRDGGAVFTVSIPTTGNMRVISS